MTETVSELDVGSCAELPARRRYHHWTLFDLDEPVEVVGTAITRDVTRGVVLYGGQKWDDDSVLNDLWILDLRAGDGCAWIEVSEDVTFTDVKGGTGYYGVWGGAMHAVRDSGGDPTFLLAGGFMTVPDGQLASPLLWTLDPSALGSGFRQVSRSLDLVTYSFTYVGDPECADDDVWCYVYDPEEEACEALPITSRVTGTACDGTFSYDESDDGPCATATEGYAQTDHLPTSFKPACVDDPYCTADGDGRARVDHTPFGLAQMASVYDPVTNTVELHGGTTGCVESAFCSPWEGLLAADAELRDPATLDQADLYAANSPYVYVIDAATGANSAYDADPSGWHAGWACAEASESTWGVTRAGAARTGLTYDLVDRTWAGSGTSWVYGGTSHQIVQPGSMHLTGAWTRDFADPNSCDSVTRFGAFDGEEDFPLDDEDCGNLDATDGIVPEGTQLAEWRASARDYDALGLAPSPKPRNAAAVTAIDGDRLVAIGGRAHGSSSGTDSFLLIDVGSGDVTSIPAGPAGGLDLFGGRVVFDPLYRRALYFGGADSRKVFVVSTDTTREPSSPTLFENHDVDITIKYDATKKAWFTNETLTAVYECGRDCWTDSITLNFGTSVPSYEVNDTASSRPRLQVTRDGASADVDLLTYCTADALHPNSCDMTLTLPWTIVDGDRLELSLEWERELPSETWQHLLTPTGRLAAFGYGDEEGYVLTAVPLWVGADDARFPTKQVSIDGVSGQILVAPGTPDSFSVSTPPARYTDGPRTKATEFRALLLPTLSPVGTANSGSSTVYVWADDGLATASLDDIDAYTAASDGLSADLDFLVERLGAFPVTAHAVVYLRPTAISMELYDGTAFPGGVTLVQPYTVSGDLRLSATHARATSFHELAHAWWGGRRDFPTDSHWLAEGMPYVLETMRYPEAELNDERLRDGLKHLLNFEFGVRDLIADAGEPEVTSRIAPYTVAQLHYFLRGMSACQGGSAPSDADVWGWWQRTLDKGDYNETFSDAGLRSVLQGLEVTASHCLTTVDPWPAGDLFYREWIQEDRLGTPVLSLREFAWTDETATDTASTCPAAPNGWEVVQVQEDLNALFPSHFETAPFFLGCSPADDLDEPGFQACNASTSRVVGAPYLLGAPDGWVYGLLLPAVDEPMPAYAALIANEMLLPEAVPSFGVRTGTARFDGDGQIAPYAPTWLLYCEPSSTDPRCIEDADADCFPSGGDCDDADPDRHPGATETAGDGIDNDCDGWNTPWTTLE